MEFFSRRIVERGRDWGQHHVHHPSHHVLSDPVVELRLVRWLALSKGTRPWRVAWHLSDLHNQESRERESA